MYYTIRKEITGSKVIVHEEKYETLVDVIKHVNVDNIYYKWVDLEVRHHFCYNWAFGDYSNKARDLYRERKYHRYIVVNEKGTIISLSMMIGAYRAREREWNKRYNRWFRGSKCNRRRGQSSTLLRAEMKAHSSLKNNEEAKEYGCKPRPKRDWGCVEYPSDCRRHNDKSWKTQSKRKRQWKGK